MSTRNNPFPAANILKRLTATLLFLCGISHLNAETRQFSLSTAKGFPIKVLQDTVMPFVHAELLVFLDSRNQNYTNSLISQLTVMNMFARELNSPSSNLLDSIARLGNDYQVEQTPEYVKISINFLPDRLAGFARVLGEIFTYQAFHLNKFNQSKEKYWSFFSKSRDWKKEIAILLAYQQIVGNFYFSQGLQIQEFIKGINLAQLRSFQLKTFRPDNALLIVKGNVNPYVVLGLLERELQTFSRSPLKKKADDVTINPGRKILVLNSGPSDPLSVYWFDVAPAVTDADHLPFFIANFTLFGFPGGRIYQSEKNQFIQGSYKVSTDVYSLKNFSVFCNYLRLNYGDLENFLMLVDQERKKFSVRSILKQEYLDALNYFLGRAQVETGNFEYGIQQLIDRFHFQPATLPPPARSPEMVREVTFERVVQVMDDQLGYKHKAGSRERGIIVLIGNAGLIMNNLKSFKADVVELRMD